MNKKDIMAISKKFGKLVEYKESLDNIRISRKNRTIGSINLLFENGQEINLQYAGKSGSLKVGDSLNSALRKCNYSVQELVNIGLI